MMDIALDIPWLLPTLFWATGLAIGYAIHAIGVRVAKQSAQDIATQIEERAKHEAGVILREAEVNSKDVAHRLREEVERELEQERRQVVLREERATQREVQADERAKTLHEREVALEARKDSMVREEAAAREQQEEIKRSINLQRAKLQELAGISADEAKKILLNDVESEMMEETALMIRRHQETAAASAAQHARRIITIAIERYAVEQVSEATTATVVLPSEEMKGRIIGREGRNIRSLEASLGVNVIIDDTPGVVVLSSFDPLRREVARRTLEQLIVDGRIHPARIDEVLLRVQSEIESETVKAGEDAAQKLGIRGLEPEVVKMLGRLRFRHSYGQNVLIHSIEMGHIMGLMAAEIGLDIAIAKRCGLLHDIGKVMTQEHEGGHAIVGADFLRKHGESATVCNAVAAHHNEVPGESWYAELTRAGDAITAARPGARSETTEIYLKRLEKLEELAGSFPGVTKCFAMEAGREIRVLVEPAKIDDNAALVLARDLSRLIEHNLEYPGQIKVIVIRETRVTEYAR
jgi:ribonuclease Y